MVSIHLMIVLYSGVFVPLALTCPGTAVSGSVRLSFFMVCSSAMRDVNDLHIGVCESNFLIE